MQALRDFWAKSLLNKLVIVGLVSVFCCCPVGLAGRGGQGSAAVAPTVAPTEAPAPTEQLMIELPQPTAEPAPTEVPTEAPTAAVSVASAGLGISRDQLVEPFSAGGFRFEESPETDRGARMIGTGSDNVAVELIGPADNLTRVTVLAPMPAGAGGQPTRELSSITIAGVVKTVAPAHLEEITAWVGEQLRRAGAGEDINREALTTGAFTSSVTILTLDGGMILTYTIDPAA